MMGWWPTCKIFAIVSLQKEGGAAVCAVWLVWRAFSRGAEPVFVNVYGAQESIPRNRYR